MNDKKTILKAENISKSFGPTKALQSVSFEIRQGEVVGLIGENGSGKSTFSTIVAGIQKQDSGNLYLNGELYQPKDINDAISHGVSMVVQEQGTLDNISVAANIFAGKEDEFSRFGFMDIRKMNEKAAAQLEELGITGINPAQLVNSMSFEERKLLEIARAAYTDPQLLLIDETTTALGKDGRDILYGLINKLRDNNKTVLFISHDIEELMNICDSIIVLRDGKYIGALSKEEMDISALRRMMVGREIAESLYRTDDEGRKSDEVALSAEHIRYGLLKDVSLQLHRGEILGVGGLTDCGMHELGKILFGIITPDYGKVTLADGSQIKDPYHSVKKKLGYVSKNRDTEALMSASSVRDNICMPNLYRLADHGLVSPKKERELVAKWQESLEIKMRDQSQFVMYLSGGNKQKVSMAKWLASDADIYIFDCPTRGIDIGVKSDIYKLMIDLKEKNKAILMISEELPELIGMSDRVLVMKDGEIKGEFLRSKDVTEHTLIDYMI